MKISRKWFSLPCILVALATTPVAIANPDAPVRRVPAGTLVDADLSRYPAVMMPGVPLSAQKRPGGVKGWQRINPKMQEALAATAIAQGIKTRMDGKSVGYAVTVMTSSGAYFAGNYDWDNLKPGIDWGDMTLRCGSQGWNLSADELARFMHTLSFTEKILPQSTVDQMRSENLGLFWRDFGEGLEGWGHGGWHPARWNNGEINTWVFTFNNGITVGVVINSRYNGNYATDIADAVREVMK